ncbi:DinB family protein [candidate division GN15 bacterium]|nr:DinB family protein [candidate division GN15 bacterium]
MSNQWNQLIWRQFGAAIETLENAIRECPEEIWSDRKPYHQYWYWAYHTLFWLDYYLSESPDTYAPPEPFTMSEMAPEGKMPDRVYSQDELLLYLEYGRSKCRSTVLALSEEQAHQPSPMREPLTVAELLLYNMRHVQHHSAQLNMLLRQRVGSAPKWVSQVKKSG